ncbi:MAG: hypothetical protein ACI9VT_000770 [Psychroserpens sp.]
MPPQQEFQPEQLRRTCKDFNKTSYYNVSAPKKTDFGKCCMIYNKDRYQLMDKITTMTAHNQTIYSQMERAQVLDKAIRNNLEVLGYGE